ATLNRQPTLEFKRTPFSGSYSSLILPHQLVTSHHTARLF
ncbi:hypothetical protein PSTT_17111, partial [Puccinia striiformis]